MESSVSGAKTCVWVVLMLMLTFHSFISQAANQYDTAKDEAGVFQGKIIDIDIVEQNLIIKKSDGEVVQVSLPGESGKRTADFHVGELVEITMTSGGTTTSVIPVAGEFVP